MFYCNLFYTALVPMLALTSILNFADQLPVARGLADDGNEPIVDENPVPWLHYVGDVLVVYEDDVSVALLAVRRVGGELDCAATF